MRGLWIAAVCAVCLGVLTGGTLVRSAREIVVFESVDCNSCRLFRHDVVRPYWQSARGRNLPMQVIDYEMLGTAGRALKAPVQSLPTSIIMIEGREVGRITGHPGARSFMNIVDRLIADLS